MPVTVTLSPVPTVTPSPIPTPTTVSAVTVVPAAPVSLLTQIQHVDPLLWTALAGILVVPFIHQAIKRMASFLNDPRHRTTNYFIAGLLSLIVGVLTDLQNSGVLTHLHNPVLATLLSASVSYALGQQVYGYFVKTNEEVKAALAPAGFIPDTVAAESVLPTDLNP